MLEQIKKVVGFNDVKSIIDKSTSIVDVFTKTIDELTEVNFKAREVVSTRDNQISKLEEEKLALDNVINNNTKIVNKLNLILRD